LEILRKNVHMSRQKLHMVSQITLDNDYNVPDAKPDVGKLILDQGEIQVDDVRPEKGKILIKGALCANILYAPDFPEEQAQSMRVKIPLEEVMHMEGLEAGDNLKIDWEIEDLNVAVIHSRKINIRAIITFTAAAEEIYDEELPLEIRGEEGMQTRSEDKELLCLVSGKRDTFRIREELLLAGNQANIQEVLWRDISIYGTEVRLMEDKLSIKGELSVFVLYQGENEKQVQWISGTIPFGGLADFPGCSPELIGDVNAELSQKSVDIKPDHDGEQRIVQADAVLELDIKLYREEKIPVLADVYSLRKELTPEKKEVLLDTLFLKNFSRAVYSERLHIRQDDYSVLQICHTDGKTVIEETRITPEGLIIEGIILVQILYITNDDRIPICRAKGGVPFIHRIEAPGLDESCVYSLKGSVERITAVMADSQNAEIRAAVGFTFWYTGRWSIRILLPSKSSPWIIKSCRIFRGLSAIRQGRVTVFGRLRKSIIRRQKTSG